MKLLHPLLNSHPCEPSSPSPQNIISRYIKWMSSPHTSIGNLRRRSSWNLPSVSTSQWHGAQAHQGCLWHQTGRPHMIQQHLSHAWDNGLHLHQIWPHHLCLLPGWQGFNHRSLHQQLHHGLQGPWGHRMRQRRAEKTLPNDGSRGANLDLRYAHHMRLQDRVDRPITTKVHQGNPWAIPEIQCLAHQHPCAHQQAPHQTHITRNWHQVIPTCPWCNHVPHAWHSSRHHICCWSTWQACYEPWWRPWVCTWLGILIPLGNQGLAPHLPAWNLSRSNPD